MNTLTIDKDSRDFLLYAFFGQHANPYPAASKRAYRDLCRTLRFHGGSGQEYREYIDGLLERRIRALLDETELTQEQYDSWHKQLCVELTAYYQGKEIVFNLGHAQKWLNMSMKYLFILGVDTSLAFPYLHVPLDQYVFAAAEKQLGISHPRQPWSKITDYEIYLAYQRKIRAAVEEAPLRWEFSSWLAEASRGTEI